MSYFEERIHNELELSVDDYTIDIDIKTMHSVKRQTFQFLKENKYGGIDIYFYNNREFKIPLSIMNKAIRYNINRELEQHNKPNR